ncbi:MAG: glycosyltransferase [Candidatus Aminicenantes bacterium]|nr:glycosyltransferase [Candidatus Aminicenantes bacterium]
MNALFFVLWVLSASTAVMFATMTILFRRGRRSARRIRREYPFVSLLKPVKGIDDDLAENLASFYRLDYPAYEILFAVDDDGDPCLPILETLKAAHPEIMTRIIATGRPPYENPKIHKLARLESSARGRLYWTTDANVRVAPDTLQRLVDEYLDRDAKVVFSPIRGTSSRTFGSLMENSGLNFFTSGSVISSWIIGRRPIIVGKSILIERAALETFGGFSYFKDFLAEDHLLGETFKKSGYRVSTNFTWVTTVNRTASPASFFRRMTRWAKLRFRLVPPVYLAEILLNPVALAAAGWALLGFRNAAVPAAVAGVKIAAEYAAFLFLNTEDRRRLINHLLFPAAVLVKDILLLAVWFAPFFSRRVEWRGGRVDIGRNTLIVIPANLDKLSYVGA